MIDDELIEKWAVILALGNNGGSWISIGSITSPEPGVKDCKGSWAGHYTEEHKQFWRSVARQVLEDVRKDLCET